MSHKTVRAQIILFGFTLFVFPAIAMDPKKAQRAQTVFILSKGQVNLQRLDCLDFPKPLNAEFLIEAPQTAQTDEDLQAYVDAQRSALRAKLGKVFNLYLNQLDDDLYGQNSEKLIAGIQPTHLFFSPNTNMLSLIQKWGTHTVSKGVTVSLKTRIDCKFDLGKETLTPGVRIIHINQKNPTKRKITATMDMLREHYPKEKLAGFNPTLARELLAKLIPMRAARQEGLLAGKNPDTLPNHIDPLNAFLLGDLEKLVAFYLLQLYIEDIE